MKWLKKIGARLEEFSAYLQTFGPFGLFAIAFLDSALIPLPGGPDAVMLLLSAREPGMMPVYAVTATVGSVAGCLVLYYISRRAGRSALEKFPPQKQARVKALVDRYDVLSVLVASVLPPPFPFKLFVVTAGVFRLSVLRFAAAVAAGRAFRFFLEGFFAVRYGERAKDLLAEHYPTVGLSVAGLIVLVFVATSLWRRRRGAGRSADEGGQSADQAEGGQGAD